MLKLVKIISEIKNISGNSLLQLKFIDENPYYQEYSLVNKPNLRAESYPSSNFSHFMFSLHWEEEGNNPDYRFLINLLESKNIKYNEEIDEYAEVVMITIPKEFVKVINI